MRSPQRVYLEVLTGAGRALLANPLRTGLGMLAIAVAVGTTAAVATGLDGFARSTRQAGARAFGSDTFALLRVTTADASRRELADKLARNPQVTRSDARFLARFAGGEVVYAALAQRRADVTSGGRKFENASVNGTAAALVEIRDIVLERGRFFRRDEEERAALVAVVGADVAARLFPGRDPIGASIRIAGRGFTVVGLQAREGTSGGVALDRFVYVPLPAFERAFGGTDSLQVFARGTEPDSLPAAESRARNTMRARRQLGPGRPDSFDVLTPEAARSFVARLSERVGAASVPISIMALLAAIVVVTNTMLVSVAQRTREIGVRRALGATRRHVVAEVLAESGLIAMAGGLAGLGAAQVLMAAASGPLGVELGVAPATAAWSLLAAGASGLAAGWYPARRASRIDPIVAIRQE